MTTNQERFPDERSPGFPPVMAPALMMAFWMLLGAAFGIRLMESVWRLFDIPVGEVSIVVPVGGAVGAVGGAFLGLISNPRLLVLLMAVFAGSAAGAVAGKLPWGDIGEIGGQVAGGLVGGIAWATWLYMGRSTRPSLMNSAQGEPQRTSRRLTAVAFDLDVASLIGLRHALPAWAIKVLNGATAASLSADWNPRAADLLVVKAGANVSETLGLCRFLALCPAYSRDCRQASRTWAQRNSERNPTRGVDAPLIVLALPGQEVLMQAALEAGAFRCLTLPIDAGGMAKASAQARANMRARFPKEARNGEGSHDSHRPHI